MTEIDKIFKYYIGIINDIKVCDKCDALDQCLKCFKEDNSKLVEMSITDEQMYSLWKVYKHIFNDDKIKYGLYGSAGTGKTTLIKYILNIRNLREKFILKEYRHIFGKVSGLTENDFIEMFNKNSKIFDNLLLDDHTKTIVLASPTNKALDVIKEKIESIDGFISKDSYTGFINRLQIRFLTISKLLAYKKFLTSNHEIYFKRSARYSNIIDIYDLVILDESSMINSDNIKDINEDVNAAQNRLYKRGFILFTGDIAQLPPPKERYSSVFKLEMNKTELKTIMRTNKKNIIDMSNFIRRWLIDDMDNIYEDMIKYKCEYINFYENYKKFIGDFTKDRGAVVLVWTNETRNKYNKDIRNLLFKNMSENTKFCVGEHLIFNTFYKIKLDDGKFKIFYSSAPVIIKEIENTVYTCKKYETNVISSKVNDRINETPALINEDLIMNGKKMIPINFKNYRYEISQHVENYINIFVSQFNNNLIYNIWKIWALTTEDNFTINVIYNSKSYEKIIEYGKKNIRNFFESPLNKIVISDNLNNIINEVIVSLFEEYYTEPFADIDYGYSMTVDKSQGSTFTSVYIDSADILDQNKYPFLDLETAKRRFYTGITRASEKINILI